MKFETPEEGEKMVLKAKATGTCWRIHDFRHTFASWLAQAGIDLHQIRDLLDHQSITMTERYAYLLPSLDSRVVRVLDEKYCYSIAQVVDLTNEEVI